MSAEGTAAVPANPCCFPHAARIFKGFFWVVTDFVEPTIL